jgi:hypothetical protein
MMDDMNQALEWATLSSDLFNESTEPNSFERKRSLLYKNEIQRRSNANKLNMDDF